MSAWAWAAATLLAIACAAAIVPKHVGDAVILSDQIFDHAKVAMIDEMVRLGIPPGNPFMAPEGGSGRLTYYYLLHFSAAELSRLLDVSAWEADIAMTFFAAFTSLAAMMAVAVRISGRRSASLWVVVLAATSSARVVLLWVFGARLVDRFIPSPGGLGGWLFQSSWAPQHLIATSCVLLAVLTMTALANRPRRLGIVLLSATIAAAFESSTWVGGVVFPLVCVIVVPMAVVRLEPARRVGFIVAVTIAAGLALLCSWTFIADQLASASLRASGSPIAVSAVKVLGENVPDAIRRIADLPAYWLLLLPIGWPAVYVSGLIVMWRSMRSDHDGSSDARAMAVVAIVALIASWLLASTLADNNDLGWRAALLGSAVLIPFAGAGLASWVADRKRLAVVLAVAALAIGVPEGWLQIERNFTGHDGPEGREFARTPALWQRVRELSASDERIASNPLALARMTPWPINIGWSLLGDRRSCYAGWELAKVFTSVPHQKLGAIDDQFIHVFDGTGTQQDVEALATVFDCRVAVVTLEDGAWRNDPFRGSRSYELVDEAPDRWRIYRRR